MRNWPAVRCIWISCARCWPAGAAVSPRMNTPIISTNTNPSTDRLILSLDMPAARSAVSSPVVASAPMPIRLPISAANTNHW